MGKMDTFKTGLNLSLGGKNNTFSILKFFFTILETPAMYTLDSLCYIFLLILCYHSLFISIALSPSSFDFCHYNISFIYIVSIDFSLFCFLLTLFLDHFIFSLMVLSDYRYHLVCNFWDSEELFAWTFPL